MTAESRFGASLAVLREEAGITPEQLADLAGTPLATVIGIERGEIEPPVTLVERLTAALALRLRGGQA
ncbi:helix-turn-helix transcriptional regulator [Agrococcus sp. ARC_14]|uniref:helix-turn-helix transcriptional regulator n=1 Tax=Agrococcus sp. ARC_14 TaxID=2919927 RepID=UPI001F070844|nr:helix-turn-helix transcriptional regulator [Agrococcus sp. ARC_14]MCH1884191.1 helix-turn-helix transcriptional regulator [Agrococcus sp. ARC_14]